MTNENTEGLALLTDDEISNVLNYRFGTDKERFRYVADAASEKQLAADETRFALAYSDLQDDIAEEYEARSKVGE